MLPGSKNCVMNSVNINARPFMGPNVYMRPPGSFTHFHQDGYGIVDSGVTIILMIMKKNKLMLVYK